MNIPTDFYHIAIDAAIRAGGLIMDVYNKPNFKSSFKSDNSPLTEADLIASKSIVSALEKTTFPIINEENQNEDYLIRKDWEYFWVVDPLDGTKEFIKRNGEFTVNIALCNYNTPIFGVIYVPFSKEVYHADVNRKEAYKLNLNKNKHDVHDQLFLSENRIYPSEIDRKKVRIVGSRSHMNKQTKDFIDSLKNHYEDVEIVSKGSSLKFVLVAEGKAEIYPRFAPTMEWDTAAGQAICHAVGLKVLNWNTKAPLLYNKMNLLNPHFIVQS